MSREEDAYVIERMGKLLAEIAIVVNGPEPPLTSWSYHDLPEKVRALKQTPPTAVPGLHPRTADLVQRFAAALAEKLAAAEAKYGYSDDWAKPGWMDECRAKLVEHVAKGDPRDVAAYAAFLWHHGERTAMPAAVPAGYVLVHVDRMLAACLPGGSSCDPQRVADAIREYVAAQAPPAAAVPDGYAPVPVEPTTMAFALPDGKYALYTAPPPRRNVTYVCPVCAASLERQE